MSHHLTDEQLNCLLRDLHYIYANNGYPDFLLECRKVSDQHPFLFKYDEDDLVNI